MHKPMKNGRTPEILDQFTLQISTPEFPIVVSGCLLPRRGKLNVKSLLGFNSSPFRIDATKAYIETRSV